MRHKMPTPLHSVTDIPEVPAMSVNSVDHLGRSTGRLCRTMTGQLVSIEHDGIVVRIDEVEFNRWRMAQHRKK
jgi:hypothetical protein